jgi:hypothetical protein
MKRKMALNNIRKISSRISQRIIAITYNWTVQSAHTSTLADRNARCATQICSSDRQATNLSAWDNEKSADLYLELFIYKLLIK